MKNIINSTIWITGASSGLGEALAVALSGNGNTLILSSRNVSELERVKNSCKEPEKILILPLDLANTATIEKCVKAAESFGQKIDYLFNNGGVSQREYAENTSLNVDRQIMEINYFGNIALTKAVLPGMIARKAGHIIVTSSVAGKYGFFDRSAYAASKHALHGFYESLRLELKDRNIHITLVCPGPINTSMAKNALTGNGTALGKSDRLLSAGLPVEKAASKVIKATLLQKEEVYFGGKEILPIYIKRFLPFLFTPLMYKNRPGK